jgi:hypothetical protein
MTVGRGPRSPTICPEEHLACQNRARVRSPCRKSGRQARRMEADAARGEKEPQKTVCLRRSLRRDAAAFRPCGPSQVETGGGTRPGILQRTLPNAAPCGQIAAGCRSGGPGLYDPVETGESLLLPVAQAPPKRRGHVP